MKLISIMGNSQMLDAGAMFGNVPKALWSRWVEVDELNRIDIACRCLLAHDFHGKNILFETGIGAFFEPKLKQRFGVKESNHVLLDELKNKGLSEQDIDYVVLSHLHFDHAGGLLSAYEEGVDSHLLFPNAHYFVSSDHWQRASNPHPRDKASFLPNLNQLLKDSGRLILVSGHSHELIPDVRFEYTNGHTPGMMHAVINEDVVFCADLIPGKAWVHIPISMGYDRFPELLIDEKTEFLSHHFEDNNRLFFTHDPDFSVASIHFENNKYSTVKEIKEFNQEY